MNIVKNKLNQAGIKPTYQRLVIMDYLEQCGSHPTVDGIYENLVIKVPTISRTTVYNTLNLLTAESLVHAVTITGTEVHYGIGRADHHHFLCVQCGRILDIEVNCPLATQVPGDYLGHQILEVHGYFRGICSDCLNKNKR